MSTNKRHPDYSKYYRSFGNELVSVQDRVRHLIKDHWPSDGAFKEQVLRSILRRHLPESLSVSHGFVATASKASTEIDILITDRSKPTLFKMDDLVIVTTDCVRAICEVKTRACGKDLDKAVQKLAENKRIISEAKDKSWAGLFVYEGRDQHEKLLLSMKNAYTTTGQSVDFIAYGPNDFAMCVNSGDWRSATTDGFAASVFLVCLLRVIDQHPVAAYSVLDEAWHLSDLLGHWCYRLNLEEQTPKRIDDNAE